MSKKQIAELAERFETLTIKKQMKVLAEKASRSRLYYTEIVEEFEKTLLQAMLERNNFNITKLSMKIKLHRNTIANKLKKYNIKEKKAIKSK